MSDEERPVKPKRKGRKVLIGGLLVLVLGGGGAGALYASNAGLLGGGGAAKPDLPHLVARDGVPDNEAARFASPTGDGKVDPAKFQATYHALGENITANLRDGAGFIQIGLGVSTYYDERVIQNVTQHEMAIRSAVLVALTDQDAEAIATPSGKEALKASLRASINDVLKKKAGFGGIDDVHFTSFVIQ